MRDFRVWRRQTNNYYPTSEHAEARHEALVTWTHWANGQTIAADELATSNRPELRALAVPLTGWLTERGLETRPHRPDVATRSAGPEIGIEF